MIRVFDVILSLKITRYWNNVSVFKNETPLGTTCEVRKFYYFMGHFVISYHLATPEHLIMHLFLACAYNSTKHFQATHAAGGNKSRTSYQRDTSKGTSMHELMI